MASHFAQPSVFHRAYKTISAGIALCHFITKLVFAQLKSFRTIYLTIAETLFNTMSAETVAGYLLC